MLRSLRNYIQQTKSTHHLTRNKKSSMIRCLPVFKKKKKNSSRSLEDETFGNTQGIKVLGADEEMKKENPKSSNVTQIFHFQSSNLQKLMEKHKKVQRHGTGTLVLFPFTVVLGEQKTHWKCSPSFPAVDTSACGKNFLVSQEEPNDIR